MMLRALLASLVVALVALAGCGGGGPARLTVDTPVLPYIAPDISEITGIEEPDEDEEEFADEEPEPAAMPEPAAAPAPTPAAAPAPAKPAAAGKPAAKAAPAKGTQPAAAPPQPKK